MVSRLLRGRGDVLGGGSAARGAGKVEVEGFGDEAGIGAEGSAALVAVRGVGRTDVGAGRI